MAPSMGGPPQGIRNSIGELARLGIHNEVVCCDTLDANWLGMDSFPVHALGPGKYGFAYTPKLGPWLEENLSRFDAVIIHGLWQWPSVCATRAVARERKRRRTKQIFSHGLTRIGEDKSERLAADRTGEDASCRVTPAVGELSAETTDGAAESLRRGAKQPTDKGLKDKEAEGRIFSHSRPQGDRQLEELSEAFKLTRISADGSERLSADRTGGDAASPVTRAGGGLSTESLNPQRSALNSKQLRCFVMPHGMLDPWFQRDRSRRVKAVRNWFYWWLIERNVVNSADALLFTCQQELELARTTFGGYEPKREINVGYGIAEPPVFEPQMREAFAEKCPGVNGRPYLLFMSRVHAKKNVAALVRAYARVRSEVLRGLKDQGSNGPKDVEFPDLVIAGPGWDSGYGREVRAIIDEVNGGQRSEIGDQRSEVGPVEYASHSTGQGDVTGAEDCKLNTEHFGRVHAVGMLAGDSKWGALYGCEAFVLPSHQENFGIAVVEALACGKPVLISDQVNIWREIADADAGFVEADTEDGAVRLLKRFMAREDVSEMAERARECYLSRFAIGPAASNFAQVLKHGAINPS
jgi:glycosyltransferase involved in cell wall biosynthesis